MMDNWSVRNKCSILSNKFEKLCISLALIIRIYHNARSSEYKKNLQLLSLLRLHGVRMNSFPFYFSSRKGNKRFIMVAWLPVRMIYVIVAIIYDNSLLLVFVILLNPLKCSASLVCNPHSILTCWKMYTQCNNSGFFEFCSLNIFNCYKVAKWFVLLTQYCAGNKIEKNEMGWACGAYEWGDGSV